MSVNKLEALVFAVGSVKGMFSPDSLAFQLNNPMMVQSFSRPGRNEITEDGVRVFSSFLAGFRANLFDADLKARGASRAGIKKDDLLENLLRVYGITELGGQQTVLKFLKRALKTQDIKLTTPLTWFLPEEQK